VSGADTRGLIAIVDDKLEAIHKSFPQGKLKYDRHLPCNCHKCASADEPGFFTLAELCDFAETGDPIQCRMSRKMVDARELIRDVAPWMVRLDPGGLEVGISLGLPRVDAMPAPVQEVYVSYASGGESGDVVNSIAKAFADTGVRFIKDRNEVKYKDSIPNFMGRIGRGKAIVVVLSDKCLRSKYCMFELTKINSAGELWDRVFPVVLGDARIYDAEELADYLAFWEKKKASLDAKLKALEGANQSNLREDLDLYHDIRATLDGIVGTLSGMNALTPEQHLGGNFEQLISAVRARLSE
jgi:hypothetical protein